MWIISNPKTVSRVRQQFESDMLTLNLRNWDSMKLIKKLEQKKTKVFLKFEIDYVEIFEQFEWAALVEGNYENVKTQKKENNTFCQLKHTNLYDRS